MLFEGNSLGERSQRPDFSCGVPSPRVPWLGSRRGGFGAPPPPAPAAQGRSRSHRAGNSPGAGEILPGQNRARPPRSGQGVAPVNPCCEDGAGREGRAGRWGPRATGEPGEAPSPLPGARRGEVLPAGPGRAVPGAPAGARLLGAGRILVRVSALGPARCGPPGWAPPCVRAGTASLRRPFSRHSGTCLGTASMETSAPPASSAADAIQGRQTPSPFPGRTVTAAAVPRGNRR